jgi:phosphatidylglycerol---prolipoprotein diacylglyceryl transferase
MHPVLFRIGTYDVPTYGFILALALISALITVVKLGRREGFDSNLLIDFSTWIVLVALIGAKVLMIISDFSDFNTPRKIFSLATLQAGGVFYGGFIAAVFFAWWYTWKHKMPILKVFDVYAPAIALGQTIGRWGCFSAGDDYGKVTNSFIGVVFTNPYAHQIGGVPLDVKVYPVQLFESAATLVIFGILLWRFRRKKHDGEIFLLYLTLYAVARFFLEFYRGDPDRGFVFHHLLSTSQFIAILAIIAAGIIYAKAYRTQKLKKAREQVVPEAKRA